MNAYVSGSQRTGEGRGFLIAFATLTFFFFLRAVVFLAIVVWGLIQHGT